MTIEILPPGPVENDEDGNPVPQPVVASDVSDLIQLMEYGRRKGFRIGPTVRVGKIVLQIRDLRQLEADPSKDIPADNGWLAENGYVPDPDAPE